MNKKCSVCNEEKLLSCFYKNKRTKSGYASQCKDCARVQSMKSRHKKYEHYRDCKKKRKNETVEKIRKYKSDRGCKYCSENFGPCLEFHHLEADEKEKNVSELCYKSWKNILKEINKCIVVCANCHRKIHHGLIEVE